MGTPEAVPNVIETRKATKLFGDVGVRDLTLEVPAGSIFGFVGPSGSGKTTTIRMLLGLLAPDQGEICVLGEEPMRYSRETRFRIGYLPQTSVLYPELSIYENLAFMAAVYGLPRRRRPLYSLLEFLELEDAIDRRLADASGGMARRLGLAAALVHSPDLVFLDEPTAGIDPVLRQKFWERFRELRDRGTTLFITTQYVGEAAYCDQVGVLSAGQLLTVDEPERLRMAAFGGELLETTFEWMPSPAQVRELAAEIGSTEYTPTGFRSVRFVVPDAGRATPLISNWCAAREIPLVEAERAIPEFDDVFVELIRRHREEEPIGV